MDFSESVSPTAAISAILGTYPFSIGLLREILQNSDDAGASRQVFLLDRRTHGTNSLFNEGLERLQGPALLAYNDATFQEDDWVALQRIHQSSKKTDTSKIGKYGVGFRSCYHITDYPQIMSGEFLAILDPHQNIFPSGGQRVNILHEATTLSDHMSAFNVDLLHPNYLPATSLDASIVRLPLRQDGKQSNISKKVLTPDEVKQLLLDFVCEEINIVMLFLSHISIIEVLEVDDGGVQRIGRADIKRRPLPLPAGIDNVRREECSVTVSFDTLRPSTSPSSQKWEILHVSSPVDRAIQLLSERLGTDTSDHIAREKLKPTIGLALPVPLKEQWSEGRLFTFLPLPLPTGFPVHIHALFALTQARQNLWNGSERGLVKGTRDEFLVEWNQVLFDTFVPEAWAELLRQLSLHANFDQPNDIFFAWPPQSQDTPGGDPAYWQPLARCLVRIVADKQLEIWPLVKGQNTPLFGSIQNSLIAQSHDLPFLPALATAGVRISQPPAYISEMVSTLDGVAKQLSPQNTREAILSNIQSLNLLIPSDKSTVLKYLLSTRDLSAIANIPLILTTAGNYVALVRKGTSQDQHILLRGSEVDLFASCDKNSIDLSSLPESMQEWFYESAPTIFNTVSLSFSHIRNFVLSVLDSFTFRQTASPAPPGLLDWVRRFWCWLGSWPLRNQLFDSIRQLNILPNTRGVLRTPSVVILDPEVDKPTLEALEELGLHFLAPEIPQSSSTFLRHHGVLKSPYDILAVLNAIVVSSRTITHHSIRFIHAHLVSSLTRRGPISLNSQNKKILRSLPIFPIMPICPGSIGSPAEIGTLSCTDNLCIVSRPTMKILRVGERFLLPIVPVTTFVASSCFGVDCSHVLSVLNATPTSSSTEIDIINLFTTHFALQSKALKRRFLQSLVQHFHDIPSRVLNTIRTIPFIAVGLDGLMKSPESVVDPDSKLADLFHDNDDNLPQIVDSDDALILSYLRSLDLLRSRLSKEVINERVKYITAHQSSLTRKTAVRLLGLLDTTKFDCPGLSNELSAPWLPVLDGFRSPSGCRDLRDQDQALFDRVLSVLHANGLQISSPSLRSALGWDKDIPLTVLKEQLERELDLGTGSVLCNRLDTLLREFGRRVDGIKGTPLENELRQITSRHPWVPVTPNLVVPTSRAFLARALPRFYAVPMSLLSNRGVRIFLSLMGCTEKPTNAALIAELRQQKTPLRPGQDVKQVISLLKALDMENLALDDQIRIPIPDNDGIMRAWNEIYYDDLGARAYDIELPTDRWNTHYDIDGKLAEQLGIQTLGSLNLKGYEVDDEDMGEDLTTRINNVLRQYSIDQAFNEFLANASDAGATRFDILIDERPFGVHHLLSPEMAPLQTAPAVIIHNDGVFTESDFKGIRRVGLGGKQDRKDAIGKFGLGALSMFHFTELAMIVSGHYVQFLDPFRAFLPRDGRRARSAINIQLSRIRQLNRDHLETLRGLYGFSPDVDFYNGTLFRLPLGSHARVNQSVPGIRISVQQAQKLVASYQQIAASSTLFIPVTTITASQRYRSGQTSDTWITSVKRETLSQEGCRYTHELVTVSITEAPYVPKCETWHIVSEKTEVENIPEDYKPLIQKHKLRNISVAIAARLPQSRKEKSGDQYRLYSKLPLPTLTSLPVHLDGSFILADDRRSIRFDEGGQLNDESRYNTWILEAKIPPLYHFLLETWPQPSRAIDLWPGTHKSRDFLTRTVIDAFYIALVGSPSKFCVSMTGLQCRPSDSVFVGNDVHVIGRIAKDLGEQELIQVPEAVWGRMRDLNLRKLDSPYILDLLKRKACTLKLAFTEKKIMIRDINHLLQFLLNDPTISESLVGLPLLPLADGSIVSLGRSSAATHYLVVPPAAGSASSWKPWPFLPAQAFVDPALSTTLLLKHKFNVSSFAGPHVVNLIATVFPRGNMRCLSHHEQRWVSSFWEQFHSLNISMADLDGFPFIPTIEQGTHVSIRHCQSDSVLGYTRYQSADVDWLPQVLVKLGAYVVNTSKCPATLQSCLPPLNIDFKSIVKFLATKVSSTLPGLFKQLSDTDQIKFAEYARNGVRYLRVETVVGGGNNRQTIFTVEHQNTARELPIWKAQKGTTSMLLAASDSRLKMLPLSVSVSTVNHFRVESTDFFVNYNVDLSGVLNVEPLSIDDLVNNFLQLPSVLSNSQVPHFYQLLSSVISTKQLPFFLPNTNLTMVNCNTLFAHSERLFRLAFRNKPELFLYPTLRDLESQLEAFGFHISVDFAAFQKCAQVVDQTRDEQSATEVYQWYSNNLWMLTRNNAVQWHQLDDLRFIPRSEIRRSYREPAFSPLGFARQLPQIVSPKEVLRTEFEPVAWTQRALFREVPSQQLLLANPSLGVPSPIHVIEHLRSLVRIAELHPSNSDVLSDLKATYVWLTSNLEDCKDKLLLRKEENLWLNVDDPMGAPNWRFSSASHLLFDGPDEGRWNKARKFLVPFRSLLLEVGAKQIVRAKRPYLQLSPADQVLKQFRESLNKQRENEQLTDVTLMSTDGDGFPAHRNILAAATEHFQKQFCGKWRESSQVLLAPIGVDVSSIALKSVLEYIYVGTLADITTKHDLIELLQVSDYWALTDLFAQVENQLIGTITLGTVHELQETGSKFQAKALAEACNEFIVNNAHAL